MEIETEDVLDGCDGNGTGHTWVFQAAENLILALTKGYRPQASGEALAHANAGSMGFC